MCNRLLARTSIVGPSSVLLVLVVGCGDGAPRTYPVQGKVSLKGKGVSVQQLAGGKVRLQSVADPNISPVGEIEDDGTFALGTIWKEKGLPGAPAGEYKVRVELPDEDDVNVDDDSDRRRRKPRPAPVHTKYHDFNKSGLAVTVPLSGEWNLELDRPGR